MFLSDVGTECVFFRGICGRHHNLGRIMANPNFLKHENQFTSYNNNNFYSYVTGSADCTQGYYITSLGILVHYKNSYEQNILYII